MECVLIMLLLLSSFNWALTCQQPIPNHGNLHVLHIPVWVSSGCWVSSHSQKDMLTTLNNNSKLPIGVNTSVSGCVNPVITW